MAARDIHIMYRCEDCRYADEYGRSCQHGLLFPILLLMAGKQTCPNFENKTTEQIEEQLRLKQYERDRQRDSKVLQ
jgi:hypothetical protein